MQGLWCNVRRLLLGDFQGRHESLFPYLLVTYVLNIPPLVLEIQSVSELATAGCAGGALWLLSNAALCLVHLANADGMGPRKRFPGNKTVRSLDKSAVSGGRVPSKKTDGRK